MSHISRIFLCTFVSTHAHAHPHIYTYKHIYNTTHTHTHTHTHTPVQNSIAVHKRRHMPHAILHHLVDAQHIDSATGIILALDRRREAYGRRVLCSKVTARGRGVAGACASVKRDFVMWQKRPGDTGIPEACIRVKRDLLTRQKRPMET